jgi:hypothetical protein
MAQASTSSNTIITLSKTEFNKAILEHWQVHNEFEKKTITQEEHNQQLRKKIDLSCPVCQPKPVNIPARFTNFFKIITRFNPTYYIIDYSTATVYYFK